MRLLFLTERDRELRDLRTFPGDIYPRDQVQFPDMAIGALAIVNPSRHEHVRRDGNRLDNKILRLYVLRHYRRRSSARFADFPPNNIARAAQLVGARCANGAYAFNGCRVTLRCLKRAANLPRVRAAILFSFPLPPRMPG